MNGGNNKNITIVVLIAGLIVSGYFVMQKNKDNADDEPFSFSLDGLFDSKEKVESSEASSLEEVTGDKVSASGDVNLPLTYQNQQFGFQLNLPAGYTGSSFVEGNGVNVLLKQTEGDESFQIYIEPFDETESISVSRIQQELPDLQIENPQNAIIGERKMNALIFVGESEDFGKTREVWFVHGGNLYQVIAPFEMEQTIGPIVESLRFQ